MRVDLDVLGGPLGRLIPAGNRADRPLGAPGRLDSTLVALPLHWPGPSTTAVWTPTRTLTAHQIDYEPEIRITAIQDTLIELEDCATDLNVVQERVPNHGPPEPHARATQLLGCVHADTEAGGNSGPVGGGEGTFDPGQWGGGQW